MLFKFAESQVAPKAKLPQIIQAVISSLASPESEMTANTLVLVAHGISGDLRRLEEMKISELVGVFSICFAFFCPFPSCHFPFLFSFSLLPPSPPLCFPAFLFLFLCSAHFHSFYFSSFANTEPTLTSTSTRNSKQCAHNRHIRLRARSLQNGT